jgi:hypothetical protein
MLTILQHKSSSYAPRTYENAHSADVTIAIAVDYNTAGEKLTHKAAGEKYLKLNPSAEEISNSRKLWARCHLLRIPNPTVNVAGNGIYTLSKHDWTQEKINQYVYDIFKVLYLHWPVGAIRSGGQTGVDLAGGVAGVALGIPTTLLLPKGFKQRHENGVDVEHTEEEIRAQVMEGVVQLKLA